MTDHPVLPGMPEPPAPQRSIWTDWCKANWHVDLDEGQDRCAQALASIDRLYNLPIVSLGLGDRPRQAVDLSQREWMAVVFRPGRELSSYDDSSLTRLVRAAHDLCVRVSIWSVTLAAWQGEDGELSYVLIDPEDPKPYIAAVRHVAMQELRWRLAENDRSPHRLGDGGRRYHVREAITAIRRDRELLNEEPWQTMMGSEIFSYHASLRISLRARIPGATHQFERHPTLQQAFTR